MEAKAACDGSSSYGLSACLDFHIVVTLRTNLRFCKNSAVQNFLNPLCIYPLFPTKC